MEDLFLRIYDMVAFIVMYNSMTMFLVSVLE